MSRSYSAAITTAVITSLFACQQGQQPPNPDAEFPDADKIHSAVDTRNRVPGQESMGSAAKSATAGSGSVSGTVSLAPGISPPKGATLFVIAKKKGVTTGPPLAVVSLTPETWPVSFSLSQANVMLPTETFEGTLTIKARLDADGNAMTKGENDLEGSWPGAVTPGQDGIGLVLGGEAKAVPRGSSTTKPTESNGKITGTIRLGDGVVAKDGAILFVMAKAPSGGPPAAVIRVDPTSFPLTFELGEGDQMTPGQPFEGRYKISARLDGDGDAMSKAPDDLVGEAAQVVAVGGNSVELVLTPLGGGH